MVTNDVLFLTTVSWKYFLGLSFAAIYTYVISSWFLLQVDYKWNVESYNMLQVNLFRPGIGPKMNHQHQVDVFIYSKDQDGILLTVQKHMMLYV